jgi:deoxyadenosine/deoxycytidine kinase
MLIRREQASIKPNLIEITGPLGAGKTELVKAIVKYLTERGFAADRVHTFPELLPSELEFFAQYYQQMACDGRNDLAYSFQLRMILHAFGQGLNQINKVRDEEIAIWEVGPFGHFMYAYCQYFAGKMSQLEFTNYLGNFFVQLSRAPLPEKVLVPLIVDVITQKHRITARAEQNPSRSAEHSIQNDYIETLITYWQTLLDLGGVLPLAVLFDEETLSKVVLPDGFRLLRLDDFVDLDGNSPAEYLTPELIEPLKRIKPLWVDPTAYNWLIDKNGDWANPESATKFFDQLFQAA